ncbi:hypothetical protein KAR91_53660 [Candidatus Pacearchaeota archaeon]|nr:hypothetical protein [Candidatus Pacearchaeota archaeon]
MATMNEAWALEKVVFASQPTFNATNGGPLDWDLDDNSNEIGSKVAGQVYPGQILITEKDTSVTITMRDPYTSLAKGLKGDLVLTLVVDAELLMDITIKDMVFLHQRAGGQKSIQAQSTLVFRYEGSGVGRITRGAAAAP